MNKLHMREKMVKSHLIQRLEKPRGANRTDALLGSLSFGGGLRNGGLSTEAMGMLSKIFTFDYMGAAEFEFGAVPAAFRFLAENPLVAGKVDVQKGREVYYVCPVPYKLDVEQRITDLNTADEYKLRLKERCGLYRYFNGTEEWDKKTVGWLELDNGFIFFAEKPMHEQFCKLFGVVAEGA